MSILNFISAQETTKVFVVTTSGMTPVKAFLDIRKAQKASTNEKVYSVPIEDFDVTSPDFWQAVLGEIPEVQAATSKGIAFFESLKKGELSDIDLNSLPERCTVYVVSDRADYPLKAFISKEEANRLIERNPEFTAFTVKLEDFDLWSPTFYQNLVDEILALQKQISAAVDFLSSFTPFGRK